jgi:hypothetical protein
MFIFATDQKLWLRELMNRIMACDHSVDQNDILKFIYRDPISYSIYFKYFITVSTM